MKPKHALVVPLVALTLLSGPAQAGTPAAHRPHHAAPARVGTAVMPLDPANPTNPLAGHPWGVYKGKAEPSWMPYVHAKGSDKAALATIALAPKSKWFGSFIPNRTIAEKVHDYLRAADHGDPGVVVPMTLARMTPWEGAACQRLPSKREQHAYKQYVDRFAHAIGRARTSVVITPDGPFAGCTPHHSALDSHLIGYSVRRLAALPHTTAYVEMGSADWMRGDPREAVRLLLAADVKQARGFALDTSHFDATGVEIRYGAKIVAALARHGASGKHFVIDTSDNGKPFTGEHYHHRYGANAILGHAPACRSRSASHCVTLGIPPTTAVADPRWRLSASDARLAAVHVDAYLWISRPWMHFQTAPFDRKRALALARTSPY